MWSRKQKKNNEMDAAKRIVKKAGAAVMAVFMLAAGAVGCQSEAASTKGEKKIDTLKIMISPYQDADELLISMEPLGEMIKSGMAKKGYEISNVEMTVGTSYTAVGEALSAGTADVGFISGGTFVTYDDECDVLLTALREAINKDSLTPSDWNDGTKEVFTEDLTTYYRSIILSGPSQKGQELKAKVDAGEKLTWEDLNSASWAVMSPSSASGYIYPSMWLKDQYGKQISDLKNVVQSDSYTTSMARLASEQVDIVVGYAHLRAKMGDTWTSKLGGTEDIYSQTGVLAVSDKILDDTVSVSRNSKFMTDDFREVFADVLIDIGASKDGQKVLETISHKGYKKAVSTDYDPERNAQKLLKENQ